MEAAGDDEWAEDWAEDEDAAAAWDEAAADWDWEAAEGVADEMALEEATCHWCGLPALFVGYPFCEGCDEANARALLRAFHQPPVDDDDATTAAGDPPEEFSDEDDWEDEAAGR
jgi:hypothetical protein